jgi:hypothetical protein
VTLPGLDQAPAPAIAAAQPGAPGIEVVNVPQRPAVLNRRSLDALGGLDTMIRSIAPRPLTAPGKAAPLTTGGIGRVDETYRSAERPVRSVGGRIAVP